MISLGGLEPWQGSKPYARSPACGIWQPSWTPYVRCLGRFVRRRRSRRRRDPPTRGTSRSGLRSGCPSEVPRTAADEREDHRHGGTRVHDSSKTESRQGRMSSINRSCADSQTGRCPGSPALVLSSRAGEHRMAGVAGTIEFIGGQVAGRRSHPRLLLGTGSHCCRQYARCGGEDDGESNYRSGEHGGIS